MFPLVSTSRLTQWLQDTLFASLTYLLGVLIDLGCIHLIRRVTTRTSSSRKAKKGDFGA